MNPASDKNSIFLAFVYGILSVCTLGLWPGYLSQTKAAQVQTPKPRPVAIGSVGMLSDFQNVTQDIYRSVRKIARNNKA
ncbi:MAG: hypothetical protein IJN29_05465 [Akkermansia sp.]|nr:hypothetical protein [Akkermansia sp.]